MPKQVISFELDYARRRRESGYDSGSMRKAGLEEVKAANRWPWPVRRSWFVVFPRAFLPALLAGDSAGGEG